ncbi:cell division topological specificity factor MinE [Candidatus Pantoea edessiphila]|uniref:Cell division topological specificity factor n=1 Tax=Candidatus Pantoea edessiphila TaxID=2044610 RepID=A0A2P5T0R6_9GAMM|nr:cell division topological specificity factor MinE [Candidatus Pantoea edessiphila]PPI88177.1 cell division topological specificity factor MinE [Candidatus Pantoea edessiphila]
MSLINLFLSKKKHTALLAKQRLQIILSEKKKNDFNKIKYIQCLKKDIVAIIYRYIPLNPKKVIITYNKVDDNISKLEINVIISKNKKT